MKGERTYQIPDRYVEDIISSNKLCQATPLSPEAPCLLPCPEAVGFDCDSYTQAELRLAPLDSHDPPIALEANRLTRGRPFQDKRQPDWLTQGKELICLEKHARQAHIPGDAGPSFQLHGDGNRKARSSAPLTRAWGTLGGAHTHVPLKNVNIELRSSHLKSVSPCLRGPVSPDTSHFDNGP